MEPSRSNSPEYAATSPRSVIKSLLTAKRMLFVAIVISVQLIFAIVSKVQSVNSGLIATLSNAIERLKGLLGGMLPDLSVVTNALNAATTAILVIQLIGLLPVAAYVAAIWFLTASLVAIFIISDIDNAAFVPIYLKILLNAIVAILIFVNP